MPGVVLWLETTLDGSLTSASNGNNPEDGDRISSWNDSNTQSLSKINLTQVTQASQPTYNIDGINGIPSLRFNNSILYSMTVPNLIHSDSYTMIAVWSSVTLPDSILMEQRPTVNATTNLYSSLWLNTSSVKFSGMNNDSGSLGTIVAGKAYINIMVVNNNQANNITNYFNSNNAVALATTTPGALDLGGYIFSVGGRTTSPITTYTYLVNAELSEIIVFNRPLKKSEVIDINSYLSKKYGITLN